MKGLKLLGALIGSGVLMAFIAILFGMDQLGTLLLAVSVGLLIGLLWLWVANEDDGEITWPE